MGSEAENGGEGTPKLQLFSSLPSATLKSPHAETLNSSKFLLTPPHHAAASVPFNWEEQPGKPRPCKALCLHSSANSHDFIKSLELPPRLINEAKFTKTPSPTTVLEGPYILSKSIFHSFRLIKSGRHEGDYDGESICSPERGLLGSTMVPGKKGKGSGGFFGSFRKKTVSGSKSHRDFYDGASFVFENSDEVADVSTGGGDVGGGDCGGENSTRAKVTKISRKRSVVKISQSRTHFWATIYGALKQVIPRRNTKWKKDSF